MKPDLDMHEIDELSAKIKSLNLETDRLQYLRGIIEGWAIDEKLKLLQPTG